MAKAAKQAGNELSGAQAKQAYNQIMAAYENMETSKGRHMNSCRREREQMTAVYERLTQFGFSQKSAKLTIKISRALTKIEGWRAELEEEDRRQTAKLATLMGEKQLSLFGADERPAKGRRKKTAPEPETPIEEAREPEMADAA